MRNRRPLNWIQWISLLTALSVAVLMPFLVVGIQNAHRDTNNSLRNLLCYFEASTVNDRRVSSAEKRQTIRLFNSALAQINEPACALHTHG